MRTPPPLPNLLLHIARAIKALNLASLRFNAYFAKSSSAPFFAESLDKMLELEEAWDYLTQPNCEQLD